MVYQADCAVQQPCVQLHMLCTLGRLGIAAHPVHIVAVVRFLTCQAWWNLKEGLSQSLCKVPLGEAAGCLLQLIWLHNYILWVLPAPTAWCPEPMPFCYWQHANSQGCTPLLLHRRKSTLHQYVYAAASSCNARNNLPWHAVPLHNIMLRPPLPTQEAPTACPHAPPPQPRPPPPPPTQPPGSCAPAPRPPPAPRPQPQRRRPPRRSRQLWRPARPPSLHRSGAPTRLRLPALWHMLSTPRSNTDPSSCSSNYKACMRPGKHLGRGGLAQRDRVLPEQRAALPRGGDGAARRGGVVGQAQRKRVRQLLQRLAQLLGRQLCARRGQP